MDIKLFAVVIWGVQNKMAAVDCCYGDKNRSFNHRILMDFNWNWIETTLANIKMAAALTILLMDV